MPLGFSLGEVVATMGFVAVSFGAKEIPFLARSLGRLAGHAVGYVSLLSTRAEKLAHDTQAQELHRDMKQSTSALIKVTKEISAGLDLSVFGNDLVFDKNDDALRENTKYLSADLVLVSDKGGMFAFQRASRRQHFTSQTKPRAATGLTNESHHPCLPSPENPFGKFSTFLIGGASGAELLTEAITASEVGKTD